MFFPENIDLSHSESYELSIRLMPDGFSFYIHSVEDPSVFHYQETVLGSKFTYTENIKRIIFDLGFFSQPFRNINVCVVSCGYTLVPEAFFDSKIAKDIYEYNFHGAEGIILSNHIVADGYHVVFQMDEAVHSFMMRNLWNPSFNHHSSFLLPLFKQHAVKNSNVKSCFADFHDGFVSVACFDGERLLSSNVFPATNLLDTIYYVSNIWDKAGLNQYNDILFVSGNQESQQDVVKDLKKLIANIEPLTLNPVTHLTDESRSSLPTDILARLCV